MTTQSRKSYLGFVWFFLSLLSSFASDAITKYLTTDLSPWEIIFFRFFFGTLSMLPVMMYQGSSAFKTRRLPLHILRGGLFFVAICFWSHGLSKAPINMATLMSFTVPLFVLILAPIFLNEKVGWRLWIATVIGFIGIGVAWYPFDFSLNLYALFFLAATALFATLDVINKRYIDQESILCMLFYSSLSSTGFTSLMAFSNWMTPSSHDLLLLFLLGITSNLILYFMLKAFALAKASTLQPIRYLELLVSIAGGYIFFSEIPTFWNLVGSAIVIPSALYIMLHRR